MSLGHGPSIVKDTSLLVHLDAANIKSYPGSGVAWTDLSGKNNHFTLANANSSFYVYDTTNKGSIDFNRNMPPDAEAGAWAEIVSATGALTANNYLYNDHTTEVWAKISNFAPTNADATEGASALVVYKGYHAGFYYTTASLTYFIWNGTSGGTGLTRTFSSLGITQNTWFQVVMSRSGSSFNMYVNGTYVANTTGTPTTTGASENNLRIASGNGPASVYSYLADCNVSNVKMYNRALSSAEISRNFNALRGRYGI
jgi:hypothetical protein